MNEDKLMGLVHQAVGDFGSILTGALVVLGDRLGLYRHLADAGRPLTSAELAAAAGCAERYVREWLNGQAASGYVTYVDGRYALSEEQATALTDETSPACVIGGFQAMLAATRAVDRLTVLFRTGDGLGWHEQHDDLFYGAERFFRPGYLANLTTSWIPALEGVEDKLRRGAKVADVGCGHGTSTIIMARAYPESAFVGFDYHSPSIDAARKAAADAAGGPAAGPAAAGVRRPAGPGERGADARDMAAVASYLADTSALARLRHRPVAAVLGPMIEAGLVATCGVIESELGWAARNGKEFDELRADRDTGYEWLPTHDEDWRRALDVQAALWRGGHVRAVGFPDLLVAAVAEREHVTVLHYHRDYELIAQVTSQPAAWVVPRGTVP